MKKFLIMAAACLLAISCKKENVVTPVEGTDMIKVLNENSSFRLKKANGELVLTDDVKSVEFLQPDVLAAEIEKSGKEIFLLRPNGVKINDTPFASAKVMSLKNDTLVVMTRGEKKFYLRGSATLEIEKQIWFKDYLFVKRDGLWGTTLVPQKFTSVTVVIDDSDSDSDSIRYIIGWKEKKFIVYSPREREVHKAGLTASQIENFELIPYTDEPDFEVRKID